MSATFLGALLAGLIIGAIPAIIGAIKGKLGLAVGGFFACVVSGLLLGMLLAIPVCAIFVFLIFKKGENEFVNSKADNNLKMQESIEDLKKYKELLESGAISQEEFDAKKKEILNL